MDKLINLSGLKTLLEPIVHLINKKAERPDWNESDPSSADYIENKPFYTETKEGTIVAFTADSTSGAMAGDGVYFGYVWVQNEPDLSNTPPCPADIGIQVLQANTKYLVTYNGQTYNITSVLHEESGIGFLGNASMGNDMSGLSYEDNGLDFCYMFMDGFQAVFLVSTIGTVEVSIAGRKTTVHKIDKKYLPEMSAVGKEGDVEGAEIFNDYENNIASGDYSHAEGSFAVDDRTGNKHLSIASGVASHSEGLGNEAQGDASHAEGYMTNATGMSAHAEGATTTASGSYSHAEGDGTTAGGDGAHAEGHGTNAWCKSQHVQGEYNKIDTSGHSRARGQYVHIVGNGTGDDQRSNAHTLDWDGTAWFAGDVYVGGSDKSTGEKLVKMSELPEVPNSNLINGAAEGSLRTVRSQEETDTYKLGTCAFAEGSNTYASGTNAHAEGTLTSASGDCAHAEGRGTISTGSSSHAEGLSTRAYGNYSHAEGQYTKAYTKSLNVIGEYNLTDDDTSCIVIEEPGEGFSVNKTGVIRLKGNIAFDSVTGKFTADATEDLMNLSFLVEGDKFAFRNEWVHQNKYYTVLDASTGIISTLRTRAVQYFERRGNYVHVVGNGTSSRNSNAHTLDWSGNAWYQGEVYVGGTKQSEGEKLVKQSELSALVGDTSVSEQISAAFAPMTKDEIDAICNATIYSSEEVEL